MDSDATKQQTANTSSLAPLPQKQFSWPLFCKQVLIASLLGIAIGTVFASPIHKIFTKVEDYVNARNDRAAYGRELPPQMRTILNSYIKLYLLLHVPLMTLHY